MDELIEEALYIRTLDEILRELEITDYEVVLALLDNGSILRSDLAQVMGYDDEEED
jgi:hypothetical protein